MSEIKASLTPADAEFGIYFKNWSSQVWFPVFINYASQSLKHQGLSILNIHEVVMITQFIYNELYVNHSMETLFEALATACNTSDLIE